MNIHPNIAALRSDVTAQRRIAGRMTRVKTRWVSDDAVQALEQDLQRYGAGEDLGGCLSLQRLVTDQCAASDFAMVWTGAFIPALREEPLGNAPFRYRCSAGFSSIQLLQSGGAALSLVAYEPKPDSQVRMPSSALFSDREAAEIVLSGSGTGAYHCLSNTEQGGSVAIITSELRLRPGTRISLDGPSQARQIVSADRAMVVLQLSRLPVKPAPSREYRLADGALLRRICGDKAASQRLMALSVLGALRSGHDALQHSALDQSEEDEVRWEAVRQLLALDTARGFAVLGIIADEDRDALVRPAKLLLEQLMVNQPALARMRVEPV